MDSYTYKYCGHVFYAQEPTESLNILVDYIKDRFEGQLAMTFNEKGDKTERFHIQYYGETNQEFTKKDRNKFGKSGKYFKYLLSCDQPFSCAVARKPDDAMKYSLKEYKNPDWQGYLRHGDINDVMEHYEGPVKKRKLEDNKPRGSFNERLSQLWEDSGKPSTPSSIFTMLENWPHMPWNYMGEDKIQQMIDWILFYKVRSSDFMAYKRLKVMNRYDGYDYYSDHKTLKDYFSETV